VPFVEEVPINPYRSKNRNRRKIPSSGPKVLRQFPRNAMPIVVLVPSLQRFPSPQLTLSKKHLFFSESSATVVRLFICSTLANSLFSPAQSRDELRFRCGSVSKVFRREGASTRCSTFFLTVATAMTLPAQRSPFYPLIHTYPQPLRGVSP
jgi:hypothetical protein